MLVASVAWGITEVFEVLLGNISTFTWNWFAEGMLVVVLAWSRSVWGPAVVFSHLCLGALEGACSQGSTSSEFFVNLGSFSPVSGGGLVSSCYAISVCNNLDLWNGGDTLSNCVNNAVNASSASHWSWARPLVSLVTTTVGARLEESWLSLINSSLGHSIGCTSVCTSLNDGNIDIRKRYAHLSIRIYNGSE